MGITSITLVPNQKHNYVFGGVKVNIDLKNAAILCPTCNKSNFPIFRRDKTEQGIYLDHCKCDECGQLFVYKSDKKGKYILEDI